MIIKVVGLYGLHITYDMLHHYINRKIKYNYIYKFSLHPSIDTHTEILIIKEKDG
jgi:hypothetical protein